MAVMPDTVNQIDMPDKGVKEFKATVQDGSN